MRDTQIAAHLETQMNTGVAKVDYFVVWATVGLTLLVPGICYAEDGGGSKNSVPLELVSRFYMTAMGTGIQTDNARNLDETATGFSLGSGWQINEQFGVEGFLQLDQYSAEAGSNADDGKLESLGIRAVVYPNMGNLYGYLGLGYGEYESDGIDSVGHESVLWSLGAGYAAGPFSLGICDLFLRAEIGFRADMHSGRSETVAQTNSFNEATAQLGFIVPFGVAPEVEDAPDDADINVVPATSNPDLDGDGVENLMDACPGTPSGAEVDMLGCAV